MSESFPLLDSFHNNELAFKHPPKVLNKVLKKYIIMNSFIFVRFNLFVIIVIGVQMIPPVVTESLSWNCPLPCDTNHEETGENKPQKSFFPVRKVTGDLSGIALNGGVSLGRRGVFQTASLLLCARWASLFI